MWFFSPRKSRRQYYAEDDTPEGLKASACAYWTWSKLYNDYYHRRKDGSYKWRNAASARAMAEAQEYANLSRQADSNGVARGFRVTFSKAPGSTALINRRIMPGFNTPSLTNPKVSEGYQTISFSPALSNSSIPGVKLGYVDDPQNEIDWYNKYFKPRNGGRTAKTARGPIISGITLSKGIGVFAPSVEANVREVSLSKVATDTRVISHIRVVVHDASSHSKSFKTTRNHWSIYLILYNQAGTVRVNMTMSEHNTEILEWTLLSYPLSLSKIQDWDFQVVGNITVSNFYQLMHENGRHRYMMGGRGNDVRSWIHAVISDLVRANWLMNHWASDEMWEYLQYFYALGGGASRRLDMVSGVFY